MNDFRKHADKPHHDSFPLGRPGRVHPTVFLTSATLVVSFVVLSLILQKQAKEVFDATRDTIGRTAGWFFIAAVNGFLAVCVYFLFSPKGAIRLGGSEARPDFGFLTWLSMLFAAGMGIGLVFWSVAEPMMHLSSPPLATIEPNSPAAGEMAMAVTYFHWGLHAWGIYALMGAALAYFSYNKGLPLTIRSTLYPILGAKTDGPAGNVVDIVASVATLFGVATSLGFGVQQVNAGLARTLGLPEGPLEQAILIAVITACATVSVVTGLDKGIRRLSESNMILAASLLLFVFLAGPTVYLLNATVQNTGAYLENFVFLSTWTDTYRETGWGQGWTIFYWGWWIAWSPFVGMFIARISRGRTLREFTLGVLLVPTVLTFVWLSIFGNAALHETMEGNASIAAAVEEDEAYALFALLENLPFTNIVSLLAIVVIVLFFVTSSDSGSLVIDTITAGGHRNPPVAQRVFWAVTEGVVAAVLLLVGGAEALGALQTASIATGLPFAIIIVLVTVSLLRDIHRPQDKPAAPEPGTNLPTTNDPP